MNERISIAKMLMELTTDLDCANERVGRILGEFDDATLDDAYSALDELRLAIEFVLPHMAQEIAVIDREQMEVVTRQAVHG